MKFIFKVFPSLQSFFYDFGDGILSIIGAGIFFQINTMLDTNAIASSIVNWGMAFIVGYGVIKILLNIIWHLLFGKGFKWKIGILDILFKRLKPVRAQEIVEATDEELEEKASRYVKKILRARERKHGGVLFMAMKDVLKNINANKWTLLGVTGATAVTGLAVTGVIDLSTASELLNIAQNVPSTESIVTTAVTAAGIALSVKAALGKGIETTEEYDARKAKEVAAKQVTPESKKAASVAKLVKKLGISEAQAINVYNEQQKTAAAEEAKKNAAKNEAAAIKLSKKLGISVDAAKKALESQAK